MSDSIFDSKSEIVTPSGTLLTSAFTPTERPRIGTPHPGLCHRTPTMHDDGAMSDASVLDGPWGTTPSIRYFVNRTSSFGGICASFGIDDDGCVFSISFNRTSARLLHLDPRTLDPLHAFELPPRDVSIWDALFHVDRIFKSNAGAYFTIDVHGRIVVPTVDGEVWIVGRRPDLPRDQYFELFFRIGTAAKKGDAVHAALPVWDDTPYPPTSVAPLGYWYLTEHGVVGVARPAARPQVAPLTLPNGERIGNSCAIGPKGIFVVSERALYRLALVDDVITVVWRTPYEQGKPKRGQLAPGSGTTPTLLGDRYVAIGDNATVMNVCLFDQDTGAMLDRAAVFGDQIGSACENSFVGHDRSFVVSNTFGYLNPMHMRGYEQSHGIVRLDVDEATHRLAPRWYRKDVAAMSAVPKLALGTGLVYVYTMRWLEKPTLGKIPAEDLPGRWQWLLLGLDFDTGETKLELPIFEGRPDPSHDNGWGTFAPAGSGAIYLGMWRGAMRIEVR